MTTEFCNTLNEMFDQWETPADSYEIMEYIAKNRNLLHDAPDGLEDAVRFRLMGVCKDGNAMQSKIAENYYTTIFNSDWLEDLTKVETLKMKVFNYVLF